MDVRVYICLCTNEIKKKKQVNFGIMKMLDVGHQIKNK